MRVRAAGPDSDERAELAARDGGGRVAGRAAYTRVYGPRAILGIEIDDDYAHRELAEALLGELRLHAERFGISILLARLPASDVALLALLREQFAARETRDGRYVEVELPCRRPASPA